MRHNLCYPLIVTAQVQGLARIYRVKLKKRAGGFVFDLKSAKKN